MNIITEKPVGKKTLFNSILYLIIIVLLGTVMMNCSKSTDSNDVWNPNILSEPMPLEIGNTWTYERLRFDGYDTILHDTVSVTVDRYRPLWPGGAWAVLDGDIFDGWWSNRDDGMWVKPEDSDPFLLFKHPFPVWDDWIGDGGRYQISTHYWGGYYDMPGMGAFLSFVYSFYDTLLQDMTSYNFCSGLGITRRYTYIGENDGLRRFEDLLLIDFELDDPPVDSSGKITFHLWVDDDQLPPEHSFDVFIRLNNKPFDCLQYGFDPERGISFYDGCYCPLSVNYLDSLTEYIHYIEIPYVPSGEHSMYVQIRGADNNHLTTDTANFVVDSGQTIYLGRLTAFD